MVSPTAVDKTFFFTHCWKLIPPHPPITCTPAPFVEYLVLLRLSTSNVIILPKFQPSSSSLRAGPSLARLEPGACASGPLAYDVLVGDKQCLKRNTTSMNSKKTAVMVKQMQENKSSRCSCNRLQPTKTQDVEACYHTETCSTKFVLSLDSLTDFQERIYFFFSYILHTNTANRCVHLSRQRSTVD